MTARQPSWLGFDGEPLTGKAPPRVIVDAGFVLTPEQEGAVAHAYRLFKTATAPSTSPYNVQHRTLPDGTAVRIESMMGNDRVFVSPPGPGQAQHLKTILIGVMPDVFASYAATAKYSCEAKVGASAPTKLKPARLLEDGAGTLQHPGSLDWFNPDLQAYRKPILVSWWGPLTRYGRLEYMARGNQLDAQQASDGTTMNAARGGAAWSDRTAYFSSAKAAVWINGIKYPVVDGSASPVKVLSAALRRVAGVLYLYLTAKQGTAIELWRGPLSLSAKGKTITVTKLFDTSYTPDTTGWRYVTYGSILGNDTAHPPQWVGPLQPLYFNQSGTHCAGLVTAKVFDAGSGSYFTIVKLMQVDIDAGTTTYDTSHVSMTSTYTQAVTGVSAADVAAAEPTYANNQAWQMMKRLGGDMTISNAAAGSMVETRYGGVDWSGDTLLVALVERRIDTTDTQTWHSTWKWNGSYGGFVADTSLPAYPPGGTQDNVLAGSVSPSLQGTVQSSWRVYLAGGATLAQRTNSLALTSALAYTTSVSLTARDTNTTGATVRSYPAGSSASSGTLTESASGDFYWGVSLEGGDLRRSCVHVEELVEDGTATYSAALVPVTYTGGATVASHIALIPDATGSNEWHPLQGWEGAGALNLSVTTDTKARQFGARLSSWVANVEVATADVDSSGRLYSGKVSQFNWRKRFGTTYPLGTGIPQATNPYWWGGITTPGIKTADTGSVTYSQGVDVIAANYVLDITVTGSTLLTAPAPYWNAGAPSVNACAWNRAGALGYVAVGGFGSAPGSDHSQQGKFIVNGVVQAAYSFTAGGTWDYGGALLSGLLVLDAPPKMLLMSPLFVDNVPDNA